MDERLQRTAAAIREAGAEWAILTSPDAVCYATGHVVPIEAGPSPFAGGPTLAIVGRDGSCGLVATNLEAVSSRAAWADTVELYTGFSWAEPADRLGHYQAAAEKLARGFGLGGTVAVEPGSFPLALTGLVESYSTVAIGETLRRARATKTPPEIAALSRAAETAAVGQRAAVMAVRCGRTELDIFADIRAAMEAHAGERIPVTGDLVSGRERTSAFGGWPIGRRVEPGDPVIVDLAPRVAGYWGDSCATIAAGTPSPAFQQLFDAVKSALDLALELIRPGLACADLHAAVKAHIEARGYAIGHHSGHSIGTAVHEWPRLVPFEPEPLRPGMVIMVEPNALDPAVGAARAEWMVEVTDTGPRVLTAFEHVSAVLFKGLD